TLIETVLLEANFKVAKFTSPHILKINERFRFNGKDISDEDFINIYLKVKQAIINLSEVPTFFEVITAMMFLYAKEKNAEYLVLEVGLGGRLDSTNIADGDYSVITNISLDHAEYLGNTLQEIAYEKAGIIKNKSVVVVGEKSLELEKAIKEKCFTNQKIIFAEDYNSNSNFYLDFNEFNTIINLEEREENKFEDKIKNNKYKNSFVFSLFGEHQYKNFLTGYTVLKDIGISDEIIARASQKVKWQCRFEIFYKCENYLVVLDGAHNLDGMIALQKAVKSHFNKKDIIIITSILKDKEINEMAKIIQEFSEKIILTSIPNNKRGSKGEDLQKFFNGETFIENDLKKAYLKAKSFNKKVIIICGSFYLLSNFKEIFQNGEI
ncbi:MAG: bifunctional folylpolyglutamate synthase/dihydrofolate synthase, partial [Fusobacteriaceae bacterium]